MSQTQKITSNFDLENFDEKRLPSVILGAKEDESKEHIEVTYYLTADEVDENLKYFQRKNLKFKNTVYFLCFLVVVVIAILNMIYSRKTPSQLVFVLFALIAVFFIYYSQTKHRKKLVKLVDEKQNTYRMNIYEECVYIKEIQGGLVLKYNDENFKVYDKADWFILSVSNQRIYILPKRCIKDSDIKKIESYFKNGLKDKFISICD